MVKSIIISGALSFLLILIGLFIFAWQYDQPADVESIHIAGSSMILHRGSGYRDGSRLVVTSADKERRVRLISKQVSFRAEVYPFMAWTFSKLGPRTGVWVGWVTKQNPNKLNTMPALLPLDSTAVYRMKDQPAWKGEIVVLGFGFDEQLNDSIILDAIEARSYSMVSMLESMRDEWFAFEGWQGYSINNIKGGVVSNNSLITFLELVEVWCVVALVIYMNFMSITNKKYTVSLATIAFLGAGWLAIDLRYRIDLIRQNIHTYSIYYDKTLDEKYMVGGDYRLYELSQSIKTIGAECGVTIIFKHWKNHLDMYDAKKLHYLLVPMKTVVSYGNKEMLSNIDKIDCIIIVDQSGELKGDFYHLDGELKRLKINYSIAYKSKAGYLLFL